MKHLICTMTARWARPRPRDEPGCHPRRAGPGAVRGSRRNGWRQRRRRRFVPGGRNDRGVHPEEAAHPAALASPLAQACAPDRCGRGVHGRGGATVSACTLFTFASTRLCPAPSQLIAVRRPSDLGDNNPDSHDDQPTSRAKSWTSLARTPSTT